jgi:hypothetical protein
MSISVWIRHVRYLRAISWNPKRETHDSREGSIINMKYSLHRIRKFRVYLKLSLIWHIFAFTDTLFLGGWRAPQQMLRDAPQPWGLLCNPEMKMISFFFSFFRVIEHRWNEIDRGKPKYWGGKPVPVSLLLPQIPHGLTRDQTQASAVRGRRLTAWAMTRPSDTP